MELWQGILFVLGCTAGGVLIGLASSRLIVRLKVSRQTRRTEITRLPEGAPRLASSGLHAELEHNLEVASRSGAGELLYFHTTVWSESRNGVNSLSSGLQKELMQAYADMGLANLIVRLSVELGCRSPELDEDYFRLCSRIAARLSKVTPQGSGTQPTD